MISRTYYESKKKPIYVTRTTKGSDCTRNLSREAVVSLEEGGGHDSEQQAPRVFQEVRRLKTTVKRRVQSNL
jgi:hypothetical protein